MLCPDHPTIARSTASRRELALRSADAVGAIVVAISVRLIQRVVRPLMTGSDDLVDLAIRLFVVEVMNLEFAVTRVCQVPLAVHPSAVSSRHCPLPSRRCS